MLMFSLPTSGTCLSFKRPIFWVLPAVALVAINLFSLPHVAVAAAIQTITPERMEVHRGSASDQGVDALSAAELSGTEDVWNQYVEF